MDCFIFGHEKIYKTLCQRDQFNLQQNLTSQFSKITFKNKLNLSVKSQVNLKTHLNKMSQLNGFINLTQLRKMNQQTLKPIISEIQAEISKIKKQSQFLKQQSQKSKSIYENNKKFEEFMKTSQQSMLQVKIKIQELKDEDLKLMLTMKKQMTFVNEQLLALKRQRAKYQQILNKQKKQNDKVLSQFSQYQKWMDEKVQNMNQDYLALKKNTLEMTAGVKTDYEHTIIRLDNLENRIDKNKEVEREKFKNLELYLKERQETRLKLIQLENKFSLYAPVQKIQYLRQCQSKQLKMTKSQIAQILQEYLPQRVKQMLPLIESKVKEIDRINAEIKDIKMNVFESQQEMSNFKQTTQSLQSNFRKQVKQINGNLTKNIQKLQSDVQMALMIDKKQTEERKKFQLNFTSRIQTFVKEQNDKIYKKVHDQTMTKLAKQIKEEELKMLEHQNIMQQRCSQVKQVSDNIEKLLAGYSSRIVKIRSDTEIFKNEMLKELKSIDQNKRQTKERFQDIGKIIASLMEILLTSVSMQMNLDTSSLKQENFAFATYNDGLVYQTMPLFSKNGQENTLNKITYRRKQMEISHLRRSLLTSMVNLVDKVYEMSPYLQWKTYKPSNFFIEEIFKNYQVQVQKYGNIQQNESRFATQQKQVQFDSSKKLLFPTKNNLDKDSSTVFRRSKISDKAYSPPRKDDVQMNTIDSQILFNKNVPSLAQHLDLTIDEGIQLDISREDSFNLAQKEKFSIKQPIKTIHEIHSRDANNNRIVTRSFHHNGSFVKEDYRTLDYAPQSAGGYRKKYMAKSKKDIGKGRYKDRQFSELQNDKHNDTETFMTSRSSRRAASIGNYKIC